MLVDLGSGAGFPGLVLALATGLEIHLIESDQRKAEFLRAVSRETRAPVTVHAKRIEQVPPFPADVVTARALAALPDLLGYAARFAGPHTVALFPKGRGAEAELTDPACIAEDDHRPPSEPDRSRRRAHPHRGVRPWLTTPT